MIPHFAKKTGQKYSEAALLRRASLILREIKTNNDDGNKKIIVTGNNIFIGSSKQSTREENQDKVACVHIFDNKKGESVIAVIIADGMGGLSRGAIVASESIAFFIAYLSLNFTTNNPRKCVEEALLFSDEQIFKQYKQKSGTTFASVVFFKGKTILANVGDSRIYKYNDGHIEQISIDDSFDHIFKNNIEKKDNDDFIESLDNRLVQFIGVGKGIKPHIFEHYNKEKDGKFILTTDGIHFLKNNIIEKIIQNSPSDEEIIKRSISLADWISGHDNATIAILPQDVILKEVEDFSGGVLIEVATNTKRASIVFDLDTSDDIQAKDAPPPSQKTPKKNKQKKKSPVNGEAINTSHSLLFEFKDDKGKDNG